MENCEMSNEEVRKRFGYVLSSVLQSNIVNVFISTELTDSFYGNILLYKLS
jgi:hypothetical protein